MKQFVSLVLGIGLIGSIAVVPAEAAESTPEQVSYGAGSVLTTLVYAPFKATFCILGAVTSGFTLPFAGPQTAGKVATTACGGTWAITPDALKGKEQVRFVGGESGRKTTAGR
jgi:hypothetical protein